VENQKQVSHFPTAPVSLSQEPKTMRAGFALTRGSAPAQPQWSPFPPPHWFLVIPPLTGYAALYTRAQSLFRDLAMARADGSLRNLLARLSRIDVLVIDDWAMAPLSEPERRDFWEICEDRYQVRSTILTSQLPVSRWHEQIGDPTLADGILDRLVHNAMALRWVGIPCARTGKKVTREHSFKMPTARPDQNR
jgi:hypothetical protein